MKISITVVYKMKFDIQEWLLFLWNQQRLSSALNIITKNLTSTEYKEKLISYLNSARCCKCTTVDDVQNTMYGIAGRTDVVKTGVDKKVIQGKDTEITSKC